MAKPKPINKNVVCSECGLLWEKHAPVKTKEPTLDDCVRLLKAELAKPRHPFYNQAGTGATGYTIANVTGGAIQ